RFRGGRGGTAVRPDLHHAVDRAVGGRAAGPDGPFGVDGPHLQIVGRAHVHGAGVRVDFGDVARFAVRSGPGQAEPLALADGEPVYPVVAAEFGAAGVHDRARPDPDLRAEEGAGV